MRRQGIAALAAWWAAVTASGALAQTPKAPAPTAPPSPSIPVPEAHRSSIGRVADALARDLARSPARALVVPSAVASDAPAPRAAELAALVANEVAARRGNGTRARPASGSLADARAAAARSDSAVIYLGVRIADGQLRVSADLYPVPGNVWARVRDPEPAAIAHAFAQAPLDAEVRSFLAPIPLVARVDVTRVKTFESDVVAVACGDIDDDGAPEIVSVSRRRVTTLRVRGGRVAPIVSRAWSDIVPVSPTPLREPIGFATIAHLRDGVALDVGLTDRARSVRLDGALHVLASFPGIALPDGDGSACARVSGLALGGPLVRCAPGDRPPLQASFDSSDAVASAQLASPAGEALVVWAVRDHGVVDLRDSRGRHETIEGSGAQLAIGDLDEDGAPEIVASLDVANPLEDAVVVRTWPAAGGKPVERVRIAAPGGVRAIGICAPDGPGRVPFVVATTDELWVVR